MAITEKYVSSLAAGGGTGNSEGSAYTFDEMKTLINAGTAAGYRFNIKADGTYTRSWDTFSGSGTVSSPIAIRGYKTVIGDGYQGRTNQGALVTTNMPYITGVLYFTGSYIIVDSIRVSGSSDSIVVGITSESCCINSSIINTKNNLYSSAFSMGARSSVINCDCENSNTDNVANSVMGGSGNVCYTIGCRVKNRSTSSSCKSIINCQCIGNTILPSSGIGIVALEYTCLIMGNTIYSQGNCAISTPNTANPYANFACFNLITDCSMAFYNPYNATANHMMIFFNNYYNNNTSPNLGFGDWPSFNTVTGTGGASTDFTDAPNGDLRLKDTSPAAGTAVGGGDLGSIQRIKKAALYFLGI